MPEIDVWFACKDSFYKPIMEEVSSWTSIAKLGRTLSQMLVQGYLYENVDECIFKYMRSFDLILRLGIIVFSMQLVRLQWIWLASIRIRSAKVFSKYLAWPSYWIQTVL